MIHFVYLVQIFSIKIKGGSACENNLCSAYTYVFSQSPFLKKSENSSVIKSWSPYVTLLNYFATFPLIWFLNSSQQTLLNLELLLSNRDRHSLKRKWERTSNISWDMNCFETWPGFFIRLKIPWENSNNTVKNFFSCFTYKR